MSQSRASTDSLDSLDSQQSQRDNHVVERYHRNPLEPSQPANDASSVLSGTVSRIRSYSSQIVTRTSTIAEAIRDDNRYADEHDKKSMLAAPLPGGDFHSDDLAKNDLEKNGAPLEHTDTSISAKYDGEYNKEDEIDRPPDGTFWGWMCVVGVTLVNAFSWGANTVYGVFLNYYTRTNHFPGATQEQYALVGGLDIGFCYLVLPITYSLVRRYHYKKIMAVGIVIVVTCWITAAEVKTITQLLMVQGLLLSLGYALAAGPTMVLIPTWFLKKRPLTNGIGAAGAGLAGIIFSRPVQALNDRTGNQKWGLRMIGIVCGFVLFICMLITRSRRTIVVKTDKPLWKDILSNFTRWDLYLQAPMISLMVWNAVFSIGYTILLFSMSAYTTSIGLSNVQASLVNTIQNVAQTIGRPLLGYLSVRYGGSNVTIILTIVLGILSLTLWVFATTYGSIMAFVVIAGAIMGVNWVNFTPLCADVVGGGDDLLAGLSAMCFTSGFPLMVAEIIGLKLRDMDSSQPFLRCQILVGVTCIGSAFTLLPLREWKIRRMFTARKHLIERKEVQDPEDEARLKRYDTLLANNVGGVLVSVFISSEGIGTCNDECG